MEHPKQHHFVPRWYLEGFTDPHSGLIHVYDKTRKTFRTQKPDKVMRINKYNRQKWAPEGIDPDILERFAGEVIEPKAKHAFKRLLEMPGDVTPEETSIILVYLEFQRVRVPRQARSARQLIESYVITQKNLDISRAYVDGRIKIGESARFEYMRALSGKITPYLCRMKWDIIRAARGSSFVTTDSPVSFYNPEFTPPAEAGLRCVRTKVLFPLNSELMLIMRHPECNIDSEVSSNQLIPEPENRDGGVHIDLYPDPISGDAVDLYNWTLAELSDCTVAGSCRDVLEKCIVSVPKATEG